MKKVISLILISVMLIAVSTTIFATESVLGGTTNGETNGETETITPDDYQGAQQPDKDEKEETKKEETLPQTGIEDYGTGILLVICLASAVFAYKKVSDYRNI